MAVVQLEKCYLLHSESPNGVGEKYRYVDMRRELVEFRNGHSALCKEINETKRNEEIPNELERGQEKQMAVDFTHTSNNADHYMDY